MGRRWSTTWNRFLLTRMQRDDGNSSCSGRNGCAGEPLSARHGKRLVWRRNKSHKEPQEWLTATAQLRRPSLSQRGPPPTTVGNGEMSLSTTRSRCACAWTPVSGRWEWSTRCSRSCEKTYAKNLSRACPPLIARFFCNNTLYSPYRRSESARSSLVNSARRSERFGTFARPLIRCRFCPSVAVVVSSPLHVPSSATGSSRGEHQYYLDSDLRHTHTHSEHHVSKYLNS